MEYSLEIRTVQSAAIKTLVEALKELLTDAVLEADDTGLRIIAMDTRRVVLVHLKLDAARFEYFRCSVPSLHMGINMISLHKLTKTVGNSDTLTLYVEADDPNHLGIKIDRTEKNSRTVYKLNLLDMENNSISVGPAQFEDVIVLGSAEFQKLCRDMHNLADAVEIKVVNDEVTFSCKGDFSTQETVLCNGCLQKVERGGTGDEDASAASTAAGKGAAERGDQEEEEETPPGDPDDIPFTRPDITQGIFSLKYLVMFTRCTNLSSNVQLFLKNDYPLIVKYNVSSLGEIKLVCAPQARCSIGFRRQRPTARARRATPPTGRPARCCPCAPWHRAWTRCSRSASPRARCFSLPATLARAAARRDPLPRAAPALAAQTVAHPRSRTP